MSYRLNFVPDFGSLSSLTLNAKLHDADGLQVGATITSGFINFGDGSYSYDATIPTGFSGTFTIYSASDPSIKVVFSINPGEDEVQIIPLPPSVGAPSHTGIFITAYQLRSSMEQITFRDTSGNVVTLAGGDRVRIKIGKAGQTPLLDIADNAPLTGGTSISHANPTTLELRGGDLAPGTIMPGIYDIEAAIVDSLDGNAIKLADRGVFILQATQGGAL